MNPINNYHWSDIFDNIGKNSSLWSEDKLKNSNLFDQDSRSGLLAWKMHNIVDAFFNQLTKNFRGKYSFENLVYFSTLHFGDNDSTGCIAGCWFGALTGFQYYNYNISKQLEFKI